MKGGGGEEAMRWEGGGVRGGGRGREEGGHAGREDKRLKDDN